MVTPAIHGAFDSTRQFYHELALGLVLGTVRWMHLPDSVLNKTEPC